MDETSCKRSLAETVCHDECERCVRVLSGKRLHIQEESFTLAKSGGPMMVQQAWTRIEKGKLSRRMRDRKEIIPHSPWAVDQLSVTRKVNT